jgi:Ca2+-binding RTX toxin-like protein
VHGNDSTVATPRGVVVSVRSSTLVIRGSAENDDITVKAHPAEGKNGKIDKITVIEKIGRREVKSFYPVNRRIDRVSLEGGAGNDRLQLEGFGPDVRGTLNGGAGNDTIIGGDGVDQIHGGKGKDHIHGGTGSDHIHGGAGKDYIAGDRGNDQLHGGTDKDHLSGDIGDDHLFGDEGNDYLAGGMGADGLRGGKHNDVLSGDGGRDFIAGGEGTDTAVTHSGSRAMGGSGNKDKKKGTENEFDLAKDGSAEITPGGAKVIFFSPKKTGSATLIVRGTDQHRLITVQAYPDQDKKDEKHKKAKIDQVRIEEEWEEPLPDNRAEKKISTKDYPVHKSIDAVVLEGGAGDDRLQAKGFGPDVPVTLSGGKGNDTLIGGLAWISTALDSPKDPRSSAAVHRPARSYPL